VLAARDTGCIIVRRCQAILVASIALPAARKGPVNTRPPKLTSKLLWLATLYTCARRSRRRTPFSCSTVRRARGLDHEMPSGGGDGAGNPKRHKNERHEAVHDKSDQAATFVQHTDLSEVPPKHQASANPAPGAKYTHLFKRPHRWSHQRPHSRQPLLPRCGTHHALTCHTQLHLHPPISCSVWRVGGSCAVTQRRHQRCCAGFRELGLCRWVRFSSRRSVRNTWWSRPSKRRFTPCGWACKWWIRKCDAAAQRPATAR
jgi:hypothetical protein